MSGKLKATLASAAFLAAAMISGGVFADAGHNDHGHIDQDTPQVSACAPVYEAIHTNPKLTGALSELYETHGAFHEECPQDHSTGPDEIIFPESKEEACAVFREELHNDPDLSKAFHNLPQTHAAFEDECTGNHGHNEHAPMHN